MECVDFQVFGPFKGSSNCNPASWRVVAVFEAGALKSKVKTLVFISSIDCLMFACGLFGVELNATCRLRPDLTPEVVTSCKSSPRSNKSKIKHEDFLP